MEAAQAKGAELRIGTVTGVSTAPVAGVSDGGEKEDANGDGERRVTGVVLENGEEIPCDRVSLNPWWERSFVLFCPQTAVSPVAQTRGNGLK